MCVFVCGCGRVWLFMIVVVFFFQAEDGIRDLVRSRGLGDVYKRQRDGVFSNGVLDGLAIDLRRGGEHQPLDPVLDGTVQHLSLIHI